MPITERDSLGRIVKSTLTSQQAKEMKKLSVQKQKDVSKGQLLVEAGYDKPDEAPEHLRILARQAMSSTPAMRDFLKLTKATNEKLEVIVAVPGELCPTCQQYVLTELKITDGELDSVVEGLEL